MKKEKILRSKMPVIFKKAVILFQILSLNILISQELEVEGDLRILGELVFSDETQISTAPPIIPAGILIPFAGTTAPDGWLLCDGSEISRDLYSNLFAVINTDFGEGDGSTTFNLPDLRGRMALGLNNMGGINSGRVNNQMANQLGGADGEENHQLDIDEMPSRNSYMSHEPGTFSGATGGTPMVRSVNSGTVGNDQAHNNMPPYIALNYIIKF